MIILFFDVGSFILEGAKALIMHAARFQPN
jgi:hypothetical protein